MEKVDVPTASPSATDEPTTETPIGDAGPVGTGPTKIGGQGPETPTPAADGGDAPEPTAPAATKVAQVLLGPPQVSGPLGPDVVDRTVHAKIGKMRICYDAQLKKNPKLEGSLTFSFIVTKAGGVKSPSVAGGSVGDKALSDCMMHQLTTLVFARPKTESTVTLPLTLVAPAHHEP